MKSTKVQTLGAIASMIDGTSKEELHSLQFEMMWCA